MGTRVSLLLASTEPPHVAKTTDSVSRGLVPTGEPAGESEELGLVGMSILLTELETGMGPAKPVDVPLKPQAPPPPQNRVSHSRLDELTY